MAVGAVLSRKYVYGAVFIASAAVLIGCFQKTLSIMTAFWALPEYSHAPIVVLLALLIGWHRISAVRPVVSPSWLGVPVLLIAGCLLVAGDLSAFNSLSAYGLVLALFGLCLCFYGRAYAVAAIPAFIYLCFAIPLPQVIYATLSGTMQLMSSTLGVTILDRVGLAVWQDGNIIDLGALKLQVVEACSGLRYMFPLMSFGFLVAFLLQDSLWKRIVVFLSSIPITIGMNALRIAVIGVTADQWGVEMAQGFIHEFEGWTVFGLCILVLSAEVWLLLRLGQRGHMRFDYLTLPRGPLTAGAVPTWVPGGSALALCAAAAVAVSSGALAVTADFASTRQDLNLFPLQVGSWIGHAKALDQDVINALQLTDYWIADYAPSAGGQPVELYVAYYATQSVGSSSHSPSNCIPGGGWRVMSSDVRTLPVAWDAAHPLTVTRVLIRKEDQVQLVYYWFDERGRDLTETYDVKWHLLWDSILQHRSDGSLIRVVTPITGNETEAAADARLTGFVAQAKPMLGPYLPAAIDAQPKGS